MNKRSMHRKGGKDEKEEEHEQKDKAQSCGSRREEKEAERLSRRQHLFMEATHRQCWTAIFMNGRVTPGVLFCCRSFAYVFGCAFKCSALQPPGGNQVDGLPPVRNAKRFSGQA